MLKLVVIGANGRMGRAVIEVATENPQLEIIGGVVDGKYDEQHHTIGLFTTLDDLINTKGKPDSIIDFSLPNASERYCKAATEYKIPYITGVTGFTESQIKILEGCARENLVFWSSNMSKGIWLQCKLAELAAKILGTDYDTNILEIHHNRKKDKPSGTALMIQKAIGNDAPITSIRAGNVIGTHSVTFHGEYDNINITHEANNRKMYAVGAIDAALWLLKQKPGKLHTLDDVYGKLIA